MNIFERLGRKRGGDKKEQLRKQEVLNAKKERLEKLTEVATSKAQELVDALKANELPARAEGTLLKGLSAIMGEEKARLFLENNPISVLLKNEKFKTALIIYLTNVAMDLALPAPTPVAGTIAEVGTDIVTAKIASATVLKVLKREGIVKRTKPGLIDYGISSLATTALGIPDTAALGAVNSSVGAFVNPSLFMLSRVMMSSMVGHSVNQAKRGVSERLFRKKKPETAVQPQTNVETAVTDPAQKNQLQQQIQTNKSKAGQQFQQTTPMPTADTPENKLEAPAA